MILIGLAYAQTLFTQSLRLNTAARLSGPGCHAFSLPLNYRPVTLQFKAAGDIRTLLTTELPDDCRQLTCRPDSQLCYEGQGRTLDLSYRLNFCLERAYLVIQANALQSSELIATVDGEGGCQPLANSSYVKCGARPLSQCGDFQGCDKACYRVACTYLSKDGLNQTASEFCVPYFLKDPQRFCKGSFFYNSSQKSVALGNYCGGKPSYSYIPTSLDEAKELTFFELLLLVVVVLAFSLVGAVAWYKYKVGRGEQPPFQMPEGMRGLVGVEESRARADMIEMR